MKIHALGRSDLQVSRFCLGTMTWGSQNTAVEAHAQIDMALDRGVNFIDTAEMYPTTPLSSETSGDTERILGQWIARSGRRCDIVLATKIAGAGNTTVGRDGAPITPETLRAALEGSLKRLRTDYVDLYQLHWPNRGSYHFRQSWSYDPSAQPRGEAARLHAILDTLGALVAEGKVRAIGLSNETAWGAAKCIELAEAHGLPRIASIQNEYSLLQRLFDLDLAELAHHEEVGLMAYTPLAAGLLTGKYEGGALPPGSRASMNPTLNGRRTEHSAPAISAYLAHARAHGLEPAQMALAFVAGRPFTASVILGATTLDQLRMNLGAADLTLSDEVLSGIVAIHRRHPIPM
ncbi:MAG: aldo/keto reductase [Rhodobacteraceae bacterium]|nr:aldo/keto reductase [Paracoccaceae bacterium]